MRIEQMFSYRSSFYVIFYCTVAACGFLFWLYQKLTRSDFTIFLSNSFRPSKPVFHQFLSLVLLLAVVSLFSEMEWE